MYAFLPFPFFWSHIFKKGDRLVEIRFEETFSIYLCFHEIDKISFQQYLLTTKCQILTLKHQYGAGNEYDLFISLMCYVRYICRFICKNDECVLHFQSMILIFLFAVWKSSKVAETAYA